MFRCVLNLWGYVQLIARANVVFTVLARKNVHWVFATGCLVGADCGGIIKKL